MAPKSRPKGDDRFTALSSDPRYRLPSAKNARVAVDKRFSRMFKEGDEDFNRKAKVDKYGRRIQSGKSKEQKNLERLYRADSDSESEGESAGSGEDEKLVRSKGRGKGKVQGVGEESDEADEDGEVEAELERVGREYDPARDGGFESSSDESSSDVEDVVEAELPEEADEQAQVPMGDVSRRLAVVNLDWDNIRASDIMAVAGSFVPADGRIESVVVYPSEFGKERLEREELEGPPKEIFAASKSAREPRDDESEEEDEEEIKQNLQKGDTGEEFDSAALRRYQLDRLRYFYAVVTCSDESTAESIYKALDEREYLSSANFFDLRFIPDEVSFDDDKPRDECNTLPKGYKPNEFVTEALTHSKVKLTWDADDATRKEAQKRAFTRAEIDENDLKAYIGGDSDSEDDAEDGAAEGDEKLSKKELERQRMRALLGLSSSSDKKEPKEKRPVGDMQITFTSGLSGGREGRNGVFENSPPRDESTRERYIRKEKERKAKRRERAKARRNGEAENDEEKADTSGSESGSEIVVVDKPNGGASDDDEKDPFDDPFFNTEDAPSKSKKDKLRKEERIKKREAREKQLEKEEAQRKQLELLMEDGNDDKIKHFDMKEIQKAAKKKGKKDRKSKKGQKEEDAVVQGPDDAVEVADPRFASLFESHEYAIDPTNPRFQKTEGMQKLLEEGRKRRWNVGDDGAVKVKKAKQDADDGADDTQKLLARVKAKSKSKSGR
ncbi:Pre-rRNA-processing protein esf1-like protein [Elsinoe fawcettii]|nr:Pre-rRNA-processing protein esf1-like protein [Elsinoe fawcettii]